MKRSTKVFLGAIGLVTVAWGTERVLYPPKPACVIGPDGRELITNECQPRSSSSSRSSSSGSSGGGWGNSSSSSSTSHSSTGSGNIGHVTSTGGWGSIGRGFSSGS